MKKMVFGIIPLIMVLMGCVSSGAAVVETNNNSLGMDLDAAIREAAVQMGENLPGGTKVALISVASSSAQLSEYVISRLEAAIVSGKKLVVVDRANLDKVREEQGFQASGEVDDDSAKSIGKLLGAGAIVTGAFTDLGDVYSITLKAINIETATVAVSYPADIARSARIGTMLASGGGGAGTGARTAQTGGSVRPAVPVPAATVASVPAAQVTAIEVTAKSGGTLYFQDKEVAKLWDNDTYTIPLDGPGTYTLKMALSDHTETRSISINTRGITKVSFGGVYTVGQPGPAGGIVFFDKGSYSDGWRYFEAASTDIAGTAEWGARGKNVGRTTTGRGSGQRNTQIIIDFLRETGETGRAAQITLDFRQGGYDDWFLPSKDELNLMYENLKQKGLGRFQNGHYWSSSECYSSSLFMGAWSQDFRDGRQDSNDNPRDDRNKTYFVRAIRQF